MNRILANHFPQTHNYFHKTFRIGAVKFISCTGLIHNNLTPKGWAESLWTQNNQVVEELKELIYGLETKDKKEVYDGIVDYLFTVANFESMIHKAQLDSDAYTSLICNINYINELSYKAQNLLLDNLGIVEDNHLVKSCEVIVENNKLKYTPYKEEALSWEIPNNDDGISLTETVVNRQEWYCLKDKYGKVRKHKNFKKVDLWFVGE